MSRRKKGSRFDVTNKNAAAGGPTGVAHLSPDPGTWDMPWICRRGRESDLPRTCRRAPRVQCAGWGWVRPLPLRRLRCLCAAAAPLAKHPLRESSRQSAQTHARYKMGYAPGYAVHIYMYFKMSFSPICLAICPRSVCRTSVPAKGLRLTVRQWME